MNYITSCPKCDTQFLLSTEHIKAYRGKVQCGHCAHVFNAKNRLTEVTTPFTNTVQESLAAQGVNMPATIAPDVADSNQTDDVTEDQSNRAFKFTIIDKTESDDASSPLLANDFNDEARLSQLKPKRHTKWLIFCLLLSLLALFQALFFLRSAIAAYYPQWKPLLSAVCEKLQCTIALQKNIGFMVIGESDMQEDESHQSVINFSSAITNNADYVQAYPTIELTLTNADDQAVIRKLIPPTVYLDNPVAIENGINAHETVHFKLPMYVDQLEVTGYRIQILY